MDIHQFDAIRPFEPTELPEVFDRLLQNEQFLQVLAYLYPGVPKEAIGMKMHQCRTNLDLFRRTMSLTHGNLSKLSPMAISVVVLLPASINSKCSNAESSTMSR